MLLKGRGLAARLHPDLERVSGDIDILVPRERLGEAERALEGLGFGTAHRDAYLEHHFHLPYTRIGAGATITVELHWQVAKRQAGVRFPVEAWLARPRSLDTPAGRLELPPAVEEVAYLAYHSLGRGAPTLRDLSDVARLWLAMDRDGRSAAIAAAERAGAAAHLDAALDVADALWGGIDGTRPSAGRPSGPWIARNLLHPATVIAVGEASWWPFSRLLAFSLRSPGGIDLRRLVDQTLRDPWEVHFAPPGSAGPRRDVARLAALGLAAALCALPPRLFPATFRAGR
jgi:hypothetical protein